MLKGCSNALQQDSLSRTNVNHCLLVMLLYNIKMYLPCRMFMILLVIIAHGTLKAQINTDQVMNIGRNALYFEDYILSIQYFNQVIKAKPYLADPYFYRAIVKLEL